MSSTPRFKRRCENYSRKDKEKLLELVTKRVDILESKVSSSNINLQKSILWAEIAKEFNEGSVEFRDDRQLKELWKRMKHNSRMDLLRFIGKGNNLQAGDEHLDGLDEFTLILVRLIPEYFQMDSDPKVRLQCRELLTIDPKLVDQRINKIHEMFSESDTNGSINNGNSSNNTFNVDNNNSDDNQVNFLNIDYNNSEEVKVFCPSRIEVAPCQQTLQSIVEGSYDRNSQDEEQQRLIPDTNMFANTSHSTDTPTNKRDYSDNEFNNSGVKNLENYRKRKIPLYRNLLDEDNEDIKRQLLDMAQKENEKELLLLEVQIECEKQRLIKEKIEAENAELKQRMLLQMLENQTNRRNSNSLLTFQL
ncbi:probable WRKY transcription factor protein 1 [Argonauta hians]